MNSVVQSLQLSTRRDTAAGGSIKLSEHPSDHCVTTPLSTAMSNDFTNLALLLRLLCFLNSKTTSPTVMGPLSKGPGEAARNANISTLEGVATILVQDHEVIATTYSTTSAVLAASESELGAGGGQLGAGGGQPGADAGVGAGATAGTDLDVQAACPSTSEAGKS